MKQDSNSIEPNLIQNNNQIKEEYSVVNQEKNLNISNDKVLGSDKKTVEKDSNLTSEEVSTKTAVNTQSNKDLLNSEIVCKERGLKAIYAEDSYGYCRMDEYSIAYDSDLFNDGNSCVLNFRNESSRSEGNMECKINKINKTLEMIDGDVSCFLDYNNGVLKYRSPEIICEINSQTGERNFSVLKK